MFDGHRVTLSTDGRIVIPVELRRELGLEPGEVVRVEAVDGRLVLTPRSRSELERRIWHEPDVRLPDWLRSA